MLFVVFLYPNEPNFERVYALPTTWEQLDQACYELDKAGANYMWRQVL
jgi:hypothetical protein